MGSEKIQEGRVLPTGSNKGVECCGVVIDLIILVRNLFFAVCSNSGVANSTSMESHFVNRVDGG